mmetsp:Transcript_14576/g.37200  ORF Transcript_14576/g.37200 Transcript_14576/m.37200 type:complete len:210 (-) Transcript_14576:1089-1718(-)
MPAEWPRSSLVNPISPSTSGVPIACDALRKSCRDCRRCMSHMRKCMSSPPPTSLLPPECERKAACLCTPCAPLMTSAAGMVIFPLPLKLLSPPPTRQRRIWPSSAVEIACTPSGSMSQDVTARVWPGSSARRDLAFKSHIVNEESTFPANTMSPCGLYLQQVNACVCPPAMVAMPFPVMEFHRRNVLSVPVVTTFRPQGEKSAPVTTPS